MEKRIFENPLFKDKITFLKTSKETNGDYTLIEVELAVGGGNNLHYHKAFSEEFTAIDGQLGVVNDGRKLLLNPGEQATVTPGKNHNFYNPGSTPIRFHVKLTPGHEGFENGIKIAYGLATDNKTNKKGMPTSALHMGVLMKLTDTGLPGFIALLQPYFKWKAKQAFKQGIEKELVGKYC